MTALDTNILIAANRPEYPNHSAARHAIHSRAEANEPWALPVFVIGEFLKVVTHPRAMAPPTPTEKALANIHSLLSSPTVRLLLPGERFWPLLAETCRDGDARGNLVFDAQIVALCREHGVREILTEDRGLRRFSGIKVTHLDARGA